MGKSCNDPVQMAFNVVHAGLSTSGVEVTAITKCGSSIRCLDEDDRREHV